MESVTVMPLLLGYLLQISISYFIVSQSIQGTWWLQPSVALINPKSWNARCGIVVLFSTHVLLLLLLFLRGPDVHFPVFYWHWESYIWHLHSLTEWSECDGTLLDICLRTANVGELDDDAAWGLARICINCLNGDLNSSKVFETQHKLPMSEQESKTHPSRQHY